MALPMRAQTEKTTFSCKDDCTLTKHTWHWTYSALQYFLSRCQNLFNNGGAHQKTCIRIYIGAKITFHLGFLKLGCRTTFFVPFFRAPRNQGGTAKPTPIRLLITRYLACPWSSGLSTLKKEEKKEGVIITKLSKPNTN